MKLAITSLLVVASMSAALHARAAGEPSEAMITTRNQSIDNNNERELLSPWCDPATPVEWHPDYSRPVQVADCDSPGYADQATCCAAQYGGQTGGACSTAATPTANPNNGKFYADYSTPWPNAGCMKTLPHPISAAVFYTTQLECCKGAFGGQSSNACVMGLPNPPTAKPLVAGQGGGWYADYRTAWPNAGCKNTTPLPVYATMFYATQLACCKGAFGGQTSNACVMGLPNPPTAKPSVAGQGGGWYADYHTAWPNAGCKNTTSLPVYATMFYATQLACCKGAFGGQTSNACVMGLPNPPTAKPSVAGQGGDWYADYGTAWPNAGCKNTTPLPIHATMFYATQLACCKGAFGGQTSNACVMGLPNPPTAKPTAAPTSKPTFAPTANPTAKPTAAPTFASPSKAPTSSPSMAPTTASPTTSNPTTPNPTTSNPTTSNQTTSDLTTSNPTTMMPTTSNPTTPNLTISNPTTMKPTTFNPTTASPAQYFFPNKSTLSTAVNNYVDQSCATTPSCSTRSTYGEIGTWRVSKVTDFSNLFQSKSNFSSDISSWDVSAATNMGSMFYGASSFNSDISTWEVSSVTNMADMFNGAKSFNSDISTWEVSSVTTMYRMFYGASIFNSNISNWNVGSVTTISYMFWIASSFNQTLCHWGLKLPGTFVYDTLPVFGISGCLDKNRPKGSTGPWCAVTNCTA